MGEEEYVAQIRAYDSRILEYQKKLKEIKNQIYEAEEALAAARRHSDKFYSAVERKKPKGNELILNNGLRALVGWAKQANELLTGSKFHLADSNLQNMIEQIKKELSKLHSDYEYYEDLIRKAKRNLLNAQSELDLYRTKMSEVSEV